ncbi:WD40-repeat-containing domain protein [Lipomyces tetrasporus]|uniref:WD40-repeat-containing domain protein n=1 Tax=Lipomyces tetrasporus TaxID=54092 RepID=A0AAD7VV21_9ASCO|nr:WD40-repeat-containing domain protein [Lipomyces tetrasporus]KAJ8102521.1 WD40-repeat-containing domain protein [Lipomyces tetrasporus]
MSVHPSRQARLADDRMSVDPPSPQGGGLDLADIAVDNDYAMYGTNMKAQTYLEELSRRQRAKQIAVPTDDLKVRAKLRELGEPITLFGEDKADRRERLRRVLLERQETADEDVEMRSVTGSVRSVTAEEGEEEDEEFYTPGDEDLLEVRKQVARYSLAAARQRRLQQIKDAAFPLTKLVKQARGLSDYLKTYALMGTQFVADRAVSIVRFSPNSELIAAGSWTGSIRLIQVPSLEDDDISILRGHTDRIGGLAWHPQATLTQPAGAVNLASGGGDCTIKLWSLSQDAPLATLQGHEGRVCRVAFHPSGSLLASASFDYTWRLWDLETQQELLIQEGHSKEVYCVAIQQDGALVVSAGLDGVGRVWDLRTGRTIMVLDGHSREIYGVDFSPNGYHIATGSGDSSVKIWDVRKVRVAATIPAHKSLVSDVRFFNGDGEIPGVTQEDGAPPLRGSYLASSSYDGCVNIWKSDSWTLIKSLKGHSEKAMSVDISNDWRFIASSGWDRSVKLWASETMGL